MTATVCGYSLPAAVCVPSAVPPHAVRETVIAPARSIVIHLFVFMPFFSSVHGVCARRAVCAAPISGHFSARFFSALSGFYYIFWLSGYQFAEYINQTFGQNRPFPALFFGRIDGRPRPHVPPFPPRLPSIYFCSAGVRARFGHIEQRPGWPRRADMFRGPMSACRCPGFCGMMLSENKTQTFVRHAQDHNLRKQRGGERQRGARKRRGGGAYGALCI